VPDPADTADIRVKKASAAMEKMTIFGRGAAAVELKIVIIHLETKERRSVPS
jgi:hypothetical protein